jgi:hypothetical protein
MGLPAMGSLFLCAIFRECDEKDFFEKKFLTADHLRDKLTITSASSIGASPFHLSAVQPKIPILRMF